MNNECLCLYQKSNFENLFHSKVKDFLFDHVHLEDDEQDQIDKPYQTFVLNLDQKCLLLNLL